MNIRQQKYKKYRLEGMNMYQAAKKAGYSDNTAKNASVKLEKVEKVGIKNALEEAGLTDEKIGLKLQELVEATKFISCNVFVDKNGKMKNVDGKSLDFIEVEDRPTQLRALELVCKLKKHLKDTSDQQPNMDVRMINYIPDEKKGVNIGSSNRNI